VADPADRKNGHLYLIVHPVTAREDALVDLCVAPATRELMDAVKRARDARKDQSFSPDLGSGLWSRRSDGMACINGISEAGDVREDSLIELTVREDGTIGVLCGRATSKTASPWRSLGGQEAAPTFDVLFPNLVQGLVHGALALAADLADHYSGYQGQWQVGLRLTGLRGAFAHDYVQSGDTDVTQPHNRDTYERVTAAHTIELADAAAAVTERLVAPLLRGLAIDRPYLPYATVPAAVVEES